MHGPDFLSSSNRQFRACSCSMKACKEAGYFPSHDALYIPFAMRQVALNSGRLFSEEKANEYAANPKKDMCLYPWHFLKRHLILENKEWKLDYDEEATKVYSDLENKKHSFPPPIGNVERFIEEELCSYIRPQDRWATDNRETEMPSWMLEMLAIDEEECKGKPPSPRKLKKEKEESCIRSQKVQKEMQRARVQCLSSRVMDLKLNHNSQLSAAEKKHEKAMAKTIKDHENKMAKTIENHEKAISTVKKDCEERLKEKDAELRAAKATISKQAQTIANLEKMIAELEKDNRHQAELLKQRWEPEARPFTYDDLCAGGVLGNNVKDFTFFDTKEQNDLFLEVVNFADGTEGSFPVGDGLCENMRPYNKIKPDERDGLKDPPCMDMNSPEYAKYIEKSKRTRSRSYKDDFFAFCVYLKSGATQEFVACLFGMSQATMSNIFHNWAQLLDDTLQRWFPTPTRSQVLRAYPDRFREADGHCRCFLLLDGVEFFAQSSSNPNVASTTYSDYKGHATVKFLGGCGTIGEVPAKGVPDGNGGRASDVMMTDYSNILQIIPFGNTGKVDKGFTIENIAAREGVIIDRPPKRRKNQKQQSAIDTAQTQKIGNTRIIIENVNGGVKMDLRYLNALIPCTQYSIISKIVRIGFLLQNFKTPFIQNRNPDSVSDAQEGRPCRAEIRWHGATDAGLSDVRGSIHLWGYKCEIERHKQLSMMDKHKDKSVVEISEMVLNERWDLKLREELYQLDDRVYDGDKFNQELYESHGVN